VRGQHRTTAFHTCALSPFHPFSCMPGFTWNGRGYGPVWQAEYGLELMLTPLLLLVIWHPAMRVRQLDVLSLLPSPCIKPHTYTHVHACEPCGMLHLACCTLPTPHLCHTALAPVSPRVDTVVHCTSLSIYTHMHTPGGIMRQIYYCTVGS
jgi:hypothetical protein